MKIDIVYTWVNGADPNWNNKRIEKAKQIGTILPEDNSEARFMDNQELKYSLRSIDQYAQWVNNIFIVTDNQVPKWLDLSHPKINIVDHKDIFSQDSSLPNFSSCAIEAHIHNIDNLSEYFIYFNDDMFLGKLSREENFFNKSGNPNIFVAELLPIKKRKSFDINFRNKSKRNSYHNQIVNTRKLLRNKFNKSIYYNIRHGVIALKKSVLIEIEKIFNSELSLTKQRSFRSNDDIIFFYLFEFYCLMKRKGSPKYLRSIGVKRKLFDFLSYFDTFYTFGFVNLDKQDIIEHFNSLLTNKPFIMCLNHTPNTSQKNLEIMKNFLEDYYPIKSSFEKK